jgi:hypothetical protein
MLFFPFNTGWGLDDEYIEPQEYNHGEDYATMKPVKRVVKEPTENSEECRSKPFMCGVTKLSDLDALLFE